MRVVGSSKLLSPGHRSEPQIVKQGRVREAQSLGYCEIVLLALNSYLIMNPYVRTQ